MDHQLLLHNLPQPPPPMNNTNTNNNNTTITSTSTTTTNFSDTLEDLKHQECRVDAELLKAAGNLSTTTPYAHIVLGPYGLAHKDSPFVITVLAVQAIVSRKLYKHAGHNLEDYYKSRFNISRAQVYRVLDCASLYLDFELRFPSLPHQLLEPYPLKQRLCKTIRSLAPTPYLRQLLWHCTIKKWVLPQSHLNDPGGGSNATVTSVAVPLIISVDELTSKHVRDVWDLLVLRGDVRALLELAINEVNNDHHGTKSSKLLHGSNLVVEGPNGPELPALPGMVASLKSQTIHTRRFRSPEPVRDAKRPKRAAAVAASAVVSASNAECSTSDPIHPFNHQSSYNLFPQQLTTSTSSMQGSNSAKTHPFSQHMYQQSDHFRPTATTSSTASCSIPYSDMVSSSGDNLIPRDNNLGSMKMIDHTSLVSNHTMKQRSIDNNIADPQTYYTNGQSIHPYTNSLANSINPRLSTHQDSRSVSPLDDDSVSNTSHSACATRNARAVWRGDSTTSDIPSPLLIRHPSPAQFPAIPIHHPHVAYGLSKQHLYKTHKGLSDAASTTKNKNIYGYHSGTGICPSNLYASLENSTAQNLESPGLHTTLPTTQPLHLALDPQTRLNTITALHTSDGANMDMMMAIMDKEYGCISLQGAPPNPTDVAPSLVNKMTSNCIDFMQALDGSRMPIPNHNPRSQHLATDQPAAPKGNSTSVRQRVADMDLNSSDMHEFLCATIESLQELARRGIVLQPLHNAIWLHDVTHWRFFTHSDTCVGSVAMHASDMYGMYTASTPGSGQVVDSSIDLGYNMSIGGFEHCSNLPAQNLLHGAGSQFNLGSSGAVVSSSDQSIHSIMAGHDVLPRTQPFDPLLSSTIPLSEPHQWFTSFDPFHHQISSLTCTPTQPNQVAQTSASSPSHATAAVSNKFNVLSATTAGVSRSDSGHGQLLTEFDSQTLLMKSPSLPAQHDVHESNQKNSGGPQNQLDQGCLSRQQPNSICAENHGKINPSSPGYPIELATTSSQALLLSSSSTGISPSPPAGIASRAFTLSTQPAPNHMPYHPNLKGSSSSSATDFQMSLDHIDSQIDLVVASASNIYAESSGACQDHHSIYDTSAAKIHTTGGYQHVQQYHAR